VEKTAALTLEKVCKNFQFQFHTYEHVSVPLIQIRS